MGAAPAPGVEGGDDGFHGGDKVGREGGRDGWARGGL